MLQDIPVPLCVSEQQGSACLIFPSQAVVGFMDVAQDLSVAAPPSSPRHLANLSVFLFYGCQIYGLLSRAVMWRSCFHNWLWQ